MKYFNAMWTHTSHQCIFCLHYSVRCNKRSVGWRRGASRATGCSRGVLWTCVVWGRSACLCLRRGWVVCRVPRVDDIRWEISLSVLNWSLFLLTGFLASFPPGQRIEINNMCKSIFPLLFGILLPNLLWQILLSPLTLPRPHPFPSVCIYTSDCLHY